MVSAHDGTEFVERNGPQFLFSWTDLQRNVIIAAVEGLSKSPYITNDVSSDRLIHEQRQQRILMKLSKSFSLITSDGSLWGIYQINLPEKIMIGLATSWYFCDPSEQDTNDTQMAIDYCKYMMNEAKILSNQINNSRHSSPGGFN